jgi:hypothetical protein
MPRRTQTSRGSRRRQCRNIAIFRRESAQKPNEELYDMQSDPDSMNNLVLDSRYSATLEGMRAALKPRVVEIKDNGFLTEGSTIEGYEASHHSGSYPVERVFELATMAAQRSRSNLPKLIAALDDPDEPIRW